MTEYNCGKCNDCYGCKGSYDINNGPRSLKELQYHLPNFKQGEFVDYTVQ